MKKIKLLTTFCLLAIMSHAQNTMFTRFLGNSNLNAVHGQNILNLDGNSYILISEIENTSSPGIYDIYVARTNLNGNVIWENTLKRGTTSHREYTLIKTSDGNFAFTGGSKNENWMYLVKMDENGTELINKRYDTGDDDNAVSVCETADGGFLIAGYTSASGSSGYGYFVHLLIKTDSNGDMLWNRRIGSSTRENWFPKVKEMSDGSITILGHTTPSSTSNPADLTLTKLDASGNPLSNNSLTLTGHNPVGEYVVAGNDIYSFSHWDYNLQGFDLQLNKIDNNGDLLWSKRYDSGSDDYAHDIIFSDNKLIVTGRSDGFNDSVNTDFDIFLMKLDLDGNILESSVVEDNYEASPYSLTASPVDEGYAVFGNVMNGPLGGQDMELIKFDKCLNSCNTTEASFTVFTDSLSFTSDPLAINDSISISVYNDSFTTANNIYLDTILCSDSLICAPVIPSSVAKDMMAVVKVYPNPANGIFHVDLGDEKINTSCTVEVIDLLGNVVRTKRVNSAKNTIDISGQSKGIYLVRVSHGDKAYVEKLINR